MNVLALFEGVGPSILAVATSFMAYFTYLVVKSNNKERRTKFIEKQLEEFYEPLINILRNGAYGGIIDKDLKELMRILVTKRYLCSAGLQNVLPYTEGGVFKGIPISSIDRGTLYTFAKQEDFGVWLKAADKIWDEYISVIKAYSELVDRKLDITEFKKPNWSALKM